MHGSKAICERYAPCNGSSSPRFQRNFGRLALGCIKTDFSSKMIEEIDNNIPAKISIDRVSATYSILFDKIDLKHYYFRTNIFALLANRSDRKSCFFNILLCQNDDYSITLSRLRRKNVWLTAHRDSRS